MRAKKYTSLFVAICMYFTGDTDKIRRAKVKELTSKYLQQAEWIYNNYLVFQPKSLTVGIANRFNIKKFFLCFNMIFPFHI